MFRGFERSIGRGSPHLAFGPFQIISVFKEADVGDGGSCPTISPKIKSISHLALAVFSSVGNGEPLLGGSREWRRSTAGLFLGARTLGMINHHHVVPGRETT